MHYIVKRMTTGLLTTAVLGTALLATSQASAESSPINWLELNSWTDVRTGTTTPISIDDKVPQNRDLRLPGYGFVRVTYSYDLQLCSVGGAPCATIGAVCNTTGTCVEGADWETRRTYPDLAGGSVTAAGGRHFWGSKVDFIHAVNYGTRSVVDYSLTFTFQGPPVPAQWIVLGSVNLGGSRGFGKTVARVNQNGTFLGDWVLDNTHAPTTFTSSSDHFTLENSLTEANDTSGTLNRFFNTDWGVTRIDDDLVTSLTIVVQNQVPMDGIGFNVGLIAPPSCRAEPLPCSYWHYWCRNTSWESVKELEECIHQTHVFAAPLSVAQFCDVLDEATPSPFADPLTFRAGQARAQFMTLMLNYCTGQVGKECCFASCCSSAVSVGEAIDEIDALLSLGDDGIPRPPDAWRDISSRALTIGLAINNRTGLCDCTESHP